MTPSDEGTPSIWFMYDCHLFAKIDPAWPDDQMLTRLRELFVEDGSGSVFVRPWEDGSTIEALSLSSYKLGHRGEYFVTDAEISAWIKKLRAYKFPVKPPTVEEQLQAANERAARLEEALRTLHESRAMNAWAHDVCRRALAQQGWKP